jgi:hypothetical protein
MQAKSLCSEGLSAPIFSPFLELDVVGKDLFKAYRAIQSLKYRTQRSLKFSRSRNSLPSTQALETPAKMPAKAPARIAEGTSRMQLPTVDTPMAKAFPTVR